MTADSNNADQTFVVRGTSYTIYQDHATGFWSVADNLLLQSEDFSTTWSNDSTTESVNQTTAPDGTTTADEITADNETDRHIITQQIGVFTNIPIRFSCYLKAGTATAAYLNIQVGTAAITAVFDLTAGTVGDTAVGSVSGKIVSASIEDAGSGWFLCTIVGSNSSIQGQFPVIGIAENATGNTFSNFGDISFNAAGTETIFVWGAHFSQQASPQLTYLKTTTSAITLPDGSEELLGKYTTRELLKDWVNRVG